MTGFDEDRELDDFLSRRSMVHRRLADRDHAEPSADLDRLVLGHAREAIEIRANTAMFRAPRWALPVGLAATLVLALAVVVHFGTFERNVKYQTLAAKDVLSAPVAPDMAEAARDVSMPPAVSKASDADRAALTASAPSTPAAVAQPAAGPIAAPAAPPLMAGNQAQAARAPVLAMRRETEAFAKTEGRATAEAQATASGDAVGPATALAREAAPPANPKHATRDGWLAAIRDLRAAGKNAEADRELADFHKAFPDEAARATGLATSPTK